MPDALFLFQANSSLLGLSVHMSPVHACPPNVHTWILHCFSAYSSALGMAQEAALRYLLSYSYFMERISHHVGFRTVPKPRLP